MSLCILPPPFRLIDCSVLIHGRKLVRLISTYFDIFRNHSRDSACFVQSETCFSQWNHVGDVVFRYLLCSSQIKPVEVSISICASLCCKIFIGLSFVSLEENGSVLTEGFPVYNESKLDQYRSHSQKLNWSCLGFCRGWNIALNVVHALRQREKWQNLNATAIVDERGVGNALFIWFCRGRL